MNEPFWYVEKSWDNVSIRYRCIRSIFSGRSKYAHIDIVETEEYGKMLFLDGVAQSAELDEFIYHETLVHPPMLLYNHPKKVCIIGGAEGATLREVLKYKSVEKVVMIDIDEDLVNICKKYLSSWSKGAFDDPRVELYISDGRKYLENIENESFDVIIVDLSDPIENSPAVYLFTQEFYQIIYNKLSKDGIATFQGETLQPRRIILHARMVNTLKRVFPYVYAYPYLMYSFHEIHSHILVSKGKNPKEIDLEKRLKNTSEDLKLKYLSPSFIKNLLSTPYYVELAYEKYKEPITDEKPFLFQM